MLKGGQDIRPATGLQAAVPIDPQPATSSATPASRDERRRIRGAPIAYCPGRAPARNVPPTTLAAKNTSSAM